MTAYYVGYLNRDTTNKRHSRICEMMMFYSIYKYAHGKETPHWGLYNNFGITLILVIMLD